MLFTENKDVVILT